MTTYASPPSPVRRGLCLILSSPSGAGKTTLARRLLQSDGALRHSISVTTRRPRPQEVNGIDYFFITRKRFEQLRSEGALLEWAEVFGNLYGTPSETVEASLAGGTDIIFDVDWQGAAAIARLLPRDTVRVFILPPSVHELSRRIYSRATDTDEAIQARLEAAEIEIAHWPEYDYVLVNHDVERSVEALLSILAAERLRSHRQTSLPDFARSLTSLVDARP